MIQGFNLFVVFCSGVGCCAELPCSVRSPFFVSSTFIRNEIMFDLRDNGWCISKNCAYCPDCSRILRLRGHCSK